MRNLTKGRKPYKNVPLILTVKTFDFVASISLHRGGELWQKFRHGVWEEACETNLHGSLLGYFTQV
jgi:hypothetical protein